MQTSKPKDHDRDSGEPVPTMTRWGGWQLLLPVSLLLWPAFYNTYPLVFADTGTYLDQALRGYAGWDRPPAYSALIRLFISASRPGRSSSPRRW